MSETISLEQHKKVVEELQHDYEKRIEEGFEEAYKWTQEEISSKQKRINEYRRLASRLQLLREQKREQNRIYQEQINEVMDQLANVDAPDLFAQKACSPPTVGAMMSGFVSPHKKRSKYPSWNPTKNYPADIPEYKIPSVKNSMSCECGPVGIGQDPSFSESCCSQKSDECYGNQSAPVKSKKSVDAYAAKCEGFGYGVQTSK